MFDVVEGPMRDMVSAYAAKMERKRLAAMQWCPGCEQKVRDLKTHIKRRDHQGYRMARALESRQNELWGYDD